MSNASIKERISQDIDLLDADSSFCVTFSKHLEMNISALERMPYNLISAGDSLSRDVLQAGWAIGEDCSPVLAPVVAQLREWLANVPD